MYGTLLSGIRVEIKDIVREDYHYPQFKCEELMERGNPAIKGRKPNGDRRQGRPKSIVVSINAFVEGSISSRR